MTSRLPFLPAEGDQPLLPKHAPAGEQLGRLLDALLVLEVERKARVQDLARRVGLKPDRLRELLSSYMVAGADAVGTAAPFSIAFGTESGPLGPDEEDDAAQSVADVVYLSENRSGMALLDDVALRPVTVEDVARGLLSARALLVSARLNDRHRAAVEELVQRLEAVMHATVSAPIDDVADALRRAVKARRCVAFSYRDPWTGVRERVQAEPYDVRRHRDRLVLDAGPAAPVGYRTFDLSGISELELLEQAFEPPPLPPPSRRDGHVDVVLRIPKADEGAESRLLRGWRGKVLAPGPDGTVDVAVTLDAGTAAARLGVLLVQLGPACSVVSPAALQNAAVPVARRLLTTLPG